MSTPDAQPTPAIPTQAEQLTIVRLRLQKLEHALSHYEDVLEATGAQREAAYKLLIEARVVSFAEAIICDAEIAPADREMWLTECAKEGKL